jgi:serine/threonine protein phosphatase PrpC
MAEISEVLLGVGLVVATVGLSYFYVANRTPKRDERGIINPRVAVASLQGRRPTMEDAHTIIEKDRPYSLFAIYDGHGGDRAALYLAENFPPLLDQKLSRCSDAVQAIIEAVEESETNFLTQSTQNQMDDGSTLVCALIKGTKLIVANVGDSEAVLSRNGIATVLTTLHTPLRNADESKRIISIGGRVIRGRLGHPHLNPQYFNVAVSRAIGDVMYKASEFTNGKPSGLIATPDVREIEIDDGDEFLILACDGVWDVISYQVNIFSHNFIQKVLINLFFIIFLLPL